MIDVVDVDGRVLQLAEEYFRMPRTELVRSHVSDGRLFLEMARNHYDVIVIDVFTTGGRMPFGRKNDRFLFNERTGKTAAVLMSLVESCKAIGLEPMTYLNDVLQEMRHNRTPHVAALTPWAWKERKDQELERKKAPRHGPSSPQLSSPP